MFLFLSLTPHLIQVLDKIHSTTQHKSAKMHLYIIISLINCKCQATKTKLNVYYYICKIYDNKT